MMKKGAYVSLAISLILTLAPVMPVAEAVGSSVTINPTVASLQTGIEINIMLDEDAGEEVGVEIIFPVQMRLPPEISDGLVTANDVPTEEVAVDTELNSISFALPAGIESRSNIRIVIPLGCRIANPIVGGVYSLTVVVGETKQRLNFIVDSLLESAPTIFVSPDLVGKPISITIQLPACENLVIEVDIVDVEWNVLLSFPLNRLRQLVCRHRRKLNLLDNDGMTGEGTPETLVLDAIF